MKGSTEQAIILLAKDTPRKIIAEQTGCSPNYVTVLKRRHKDIIEKIRQERGTVTHEKETPLEPSPIINRESQNKAEEILIEALEGLKDRMLESPNSMDIAEYIDAMKTLWELIHEKSKLWENLNAQPSSNIEQGNSTESETDDAGSTAKQAVDEMAKMVAELAPEVLDAGSE